MAVHYRTQAVVFKKEDRLDADRVFSAFTKDFGRVEVFGKAIRKITSKLKSNIDFFSFSEIEFIQGKNRKTLTDAVSIEKLDGKVHLVEKLEIAYNISNIIDCFIRGQEKDERIWGLIVDISRKLNNIHIVHNKELLYYYFLWNFMFVLGYGPEISNCAVCRQKLNPHSLYFSNKEGGVICKDCAATKKDGVKITPDVVKVLRLILEKDWDILSKLKVGIDSSRLLKEVSDNYCNYLPASNSNYQYSP